MGQLITVLLAVIIFGYGGYQAYQTLKKGSRGECQGCSCEDSSGNCSKSAFKYVELSTDEEEHEKE